MLTRHIAFSGQNRIGNSVWIFAAFFAAALAFDFAMQQTAAADEVMTTFFSDNYNVYGNKKGTAIGGPSTNDTPNDSAAEFSERWAIHSAERLLTCFRSATAIIILRYFRLPIKIPDIQPA